MKYTESKKKLDAVRQKYGCKGEIVLRTAIQYIVEHGQCKFNNQAWFDACIENVDKRHNLADKEGKILFITRDFEKSLLECAKELAQVKAYDLLMYIQREVWLGGNGIDYQRAIELCKAIINWTVQDTYETSIALEAIREIGFSDNEIDELGYGWMLDIECEED